MQLLYFAWVRERTGIAGETVSLPETVVTAADLVLWLQGRGDTFAYAFENPATIRVSADHEHVTPDTDIRAASEIALFPPMTGG